MLGLAVSYVKGVNIVPSGQSRPGSIRRGDQAEHPSRT